MLTCDHCLLEFQGSKAVFDEVNGRKKAFCCYGCRGVYRLINDEGLDAFYDKRGSSWVPGPAQEVKIEPSAFAGKIRRSGDEDEIDIVIDGIRCASCIWLIERALLKKKGVTYCRANYATHRAKIRWAPEIAGINEILERIISIGYIPKPFDAEAYESELRKERRDLLMRFGTAAFFSMQLMMFSVALYAGYFQGIGDRTRGAFQIISLLLTTPVLFYSGWPILKGSISGLRNLSFNMDVLIATGAGSAYLFSAYQIYAGGEVYFDTAAMIVTLILLGRYIETGAKGRASNVITRLLSLNPKEARRIIKQGSELSEMVSISSIKTDDWIQVKPGERIPLDGVILNGRSEIDESMLTGESMPVSKAEGSEVFCGTQNLYGSFIFKVSRTGEDTVFSQIIKTVEDAQARRAPVQALADRAVGVFVPAVLFLGFVTGLGWWVYSGDLTNAVMNAVSVLVIACPCALGLATPLAILIGTTSGASKGILIKGGDIIERSKGIDTVVLDKTGTVTEGRPLLKSYKGIGCSDEDALRLASSLERLSEHSISKAIVDASEVQPLTVSEFKAEPGNGIKGKIDGKDVLVGNRNFIEAEGIFKGVEDELGPELFLQADFEEMSGSTVVYLSYDKRLAGIFVIADSIRKEAGEVIRNLIESGYDVMMMTGDNRKTALSVASKIGLKTDMIRAEVSPVEKAEIIKGLQREGRKVLMAGDGINDAPALVQADVGIAVGRATDIALESADMVIMRNDLRLIPEALKLSGRTYSVIKQNLFWAFVYNIAAIPLATAGLLHPIMAAAAMTFSSLSVVGNSMRLKVN
ncbi:MAG: heavy metal translocating P-type ATPase [Thermodesulfovibrionia bacterium]|nr:heavy metal translocating P-type ATPase [Thermodesulfovibrionia bacterium]